MAPKSRPDSGPSLQDPGVLAASLGCRACWKRLKAVEAALNTHPGMAAGLRDAVKRMASIDLGS